MILPLSENAAEVDAAAAVGGGVREHGKEVGETDVERAARSEEGGRAAAGGWGGAGGRGVGGGGGEGAGLAPLPGGGEGAARACAPPGLARYAPTPGGAGLVGSFARAHRRVVPEQDPLRPEQI